MVDVPERSVVVVLSRVEAEMKELTAQRSIQDNRPAADDVLRPNLEREEERPADVGSWAGRTRTLNGKTLMECRVFALFEYYLNGTDQVTKTLKYHRFRMAFWDCAELKITNFV